VSDGHALSFLGGGSAPVTPTVYTPPTADQIAAMASTLPGAGGGEIATGAGTELTPNTGVQASAALGAALDYAGSHPGTMAANAAAIGLAALGGPLAMALALGKAAFTDFITAAPKAALSDLFGGGSSSGSVTAPVDNPGSPGYGGFQGSMLGAATGQSSPVDLSGIGTDPGAPGGAGTAAQAGTAGGGSGSAAPGGPALI